MEVVKLKLSTTRTDVVYSPSKGLDDTLLLGASWNLALLAVFFDIIGNRRCHMELMGIWVRLLGSLEVEDLTCPQLIVLLNNATTRQLST